VISLHCTTCTLHCTTCTLHCTTCTLNFTTCTLHCTTCTLHYTLHSLRYTALRTQFVCHPDIQTHLFLLNTLLVSFITHTHTHTYTHTYIHTYVNVHIITHRFRPLSAFGPLSVAPWGCPRRFDCQHRALMSECLSSLFVLSVYSSVYNKTTLNHKQQVLHTTYIWYTKNDKEIAMNVTFDI
jgi:hypothetical protein